MPHIVILGGGISGLSAAWFCKQKGYTVTVVEKSARAGGSIRTIGVEGFLFDMGPRSCRVRGNGIETLRLIEHLGLQEEVIPADKSSRKRYLYSNKKLISVPNCPVAVLISPFTKGILKGLWRDWRTPPAHLDDESIHSFVSRRMNSEVAEQLIDPLTSGIFAGDTTQLSIKSCFPILYEWEQKYGGIVRGAFARRKKTSQMLSPFLQKMLKHPIFTFKGGMERLPQTLSEQLTQELLLSTTVRGLHWKEEGIDVELSNGKTIQASHVLSTMPAEALGDLLMPYLPGTALTLQGMVTASMAVVSVGYKSKVLKKKGFGYLIPSREREEVLGVVWDSVAFPQQNRTSEQTRLSVMIGGIRMKDFGSRTEKEFKEIALRALERHLGIKAQPDVVHVHCAKGAIPQYVVGHAAKVAQIEKEIATLSPHLSILGMPYYGVSINDCIAKARQFADQKPKI